MRRYTPRGNLDQKNFENQHFSLSASYLKNSFLCFKDNAQINGTFMEFLARENLLALVPLFEGAHVIQGYGLLDEIPTLYGLIWNTPKFIRSLMARLTGNTSTENTGKL